MAMVTKLKQAANDYDKTLRVWLYPEYDSVGEAMLALHRQLIAGQAPISTPEFQAFMIKKFKTMREALFKRLSEADSKVSLGFGYSCLQQPMEWEGEEAPEVRKFAVVEAQFIDSNWRRQRFYLDFIYLDGAIRASQQQQYMVPFQEMFGSMGLADLIAPNGKHEVQHLLGVLLGKDQLGIGKKLGVLSTGHLTLGMLIGCHNRTTGKCVASLYELLDCTLLEILISSEENEAKLKAAELVKGVKKDKVTDLLDLKFVTDAKALATEINSAPHCLTVMEESIRFLKMIQHKKGLFEGLLGKRFKWDDLNAWQKVCSALLISTSNKVIPYVDWLSSTAVSRLVDLRKDLGIIKPVTPMLQQIIDQIDGGKAITGWPLGECWFIGTVLDPRFSLAYFKDNVVPTWPHSKVKEVMEAKILGYGGAGRKELAAYYGTTPISSTSDPLIWWKVNADRFPTLAKMARDYLGMLAVPTGMTQTTSLGIFWEDASTAYSEKERSKKEQKKTPICSERYLDDFSEYVEMVRTSACLRNWTQRKP